MKRTIAILSMLAITLMIVFTSCNSRGVDSSDREQAKQQEAIAKEADAEIGMPAITNFSEKKMMKTIMEARDDAKLVNYAYLYSEITGKFTFIGKCIGFGLPYSTQFTNPTKTVDKDAHYGIEQLPQADPNGLFMPESADGTWLMLIDDKGEPRVTYFEPKIVVMPMPLPDEVVINPPKKTTTENRVLPTEPKI